MDFTMSDLIGLLKKTWWIIVIAAVVGAGVGFAFSAIIASSNYSSHVVIMVDYKSDSTNDSWSAQDDLDYSKSMIGNCITLLKQNRFYKQVSDYIYKEHSVSYSVSIIESKITYVNDSDTSTFTATVTTNKARMSYLIAEGIAKVTVDLDYIVETYPNFDDQHTKISTINEIVQAENPDDNSQFLLYLAVGAVGIAAVAFLVLLIIDMLDKRIKDVTYLAAKYGYPVIGVIPSGKNTDGGNE